MASKPKPTPPLDNSKPQSDPLSIQRGDYGPSSLTSTLLFTIGRAISGPLQYYIITRHPLQALFPSLPPVPSGGLPITLTIPTSLNSSLGIAQTQSFYRLPLLCASMPALLTVKQLIWCLFLMKERMTLPFAFFAVVADFLYEGISSLVFTTAGANPLWSERLFYSAFTLFSASVLIELIAELQRYAFKAKVENKGKVCKDGLWGVVRHVNYTANMVYGWAYGLCCGGPVYSVLTAGMYVANLGSNAMPGKEKYMQEKYGEEWEKYCEETRWKFFPGIW